jgi:hypothetical protein
VQIGAADAAAVDLDANLPSKRSWLPALHAPQWLARDRPWLVDGPGVHLAILTSRRWRGEPSAARLALGQSKPFVLHELDQVAAADLQHLTALGVAGNHSNHHIVSGVVLNLDAPALER